MNIGFVHPWLSAIKSWREEKQNPLLLMLAASSTPDQAMGSLAALLISR